MHFSWAVITGASSGIGEAFARFLAARGTNLLLAARREDRLTALARDLPGEVRVVRADLTQPEDRQRLWDEVLTLGASVELLVNNAGFGLRGAMHELDRVRQLEMLEINMVALTDLAHRFAILRQQAGGSGALINNASVVGLRPVPFHAVYAATKAYVVSLSLSLSEELAPLGIRVQALCPGPVPTEFQAVAGVVLDRRSALVTIPAEQVVRESFEALDRNQPLLVPGLRLRTLVRLHQAMPPSLARVLANRAMRRDRSSSSP